MINHLSVFLRVFVGMALLSIPMGCRTPLQQRRQADQTATRLIADAQLGALGEQEDIRLVNPGEALRRKLVIEGALPTAGPASLGLHDLPENPYWKQSRHVPPQEDENPTEQVALTAPKHLTLVDALTIYAGNSRSYQAEKEELYRTALDLDVEADGFRSSFTGMISGLLDSRYEDGERITGTETGLDFGITRTFRNGAEFAGAVTADLVSMLTRDKASTWGVRADASITIPLLRGSGWKIATADLTRAQRNLLYAVYDFEEAKRAFAVEVAEGFYNVLETRNSLANAEENYRRLISSTRRARRLADSGRLPDFQYDQAIQDELKARDRWVRARQSYRGSLERFRILLGLPPDVGLTPSADEMAKLRSLLPSQPADQDTVLPEEEVPPADAPVELTPPGAGNNGKYELQPGRALELALNNRLDLKKALAEVEDAQRNVYVAADQLRPEFTLLGTAESGAARSVSSADSDDEWPKTHQGTYSGLLTLDLPFERTEERSQYRKELLDLNQAIRDLQELEDEIKQEILGRLRELLQARESVRIQRQAVTLAEKRVRSTDLFLQAGRAEIRDLLDAEDDLLTARNSLASALVDYRVSELALQRDLGVLKVTADGIVTEFNP